MKKLILLLVVLLLCGCQEQGAKTPEVVVYVALDQVYSEPILNNFERQTGIKVRAKYDLEATKTSGLVNQIITERANPQCDVFWNNEILQTTVLKKLGSLQPYRSPNAEGIPALFRDPEDCWTGFAARMRVLVYNPENLNGRTPPGSIEELTDPKWKGEAGMALPLFGTTLTHWAALYHQRGAAETEQFLKKALANDLAIVDGNSVVKDRVASGMLTWGLTDTDDANSAIEEGAKIVMVFPDQEEGQMGTLVIPNTVAIVKDCPHPEEAKKLVDFLLATEIEEHLARGRSLQIPLHEKAQRPEGVPDISKMKVMEVDYPAIAENFTDVLNKLRELVTP